MDIDRDNLRQDWEDTKETLREDYDAAARKVHDLGEGLKDRTELGEKEAETKYHDLRHDLNDEDT